MTGETRLFEYSSTQIYLQIVYISKSLEEIHAYFKRNHRNKFKLEKQHQ
jgi:hypothetical protein